MYRQADPGSEIDPKVVRLAIVVAIVQLCRHVDVRRIDETVHGHGVVRRQLVDDPVRHRDRATRVLVTSDATLQRKQ